jgi:hypothetical protein
MTGTASSAWDALFEGIFGQFRRVTARWAGILAFSRGMV